MSEQLSIDFSGKTFDRSFQPHETDLVATDWVIA